MRILHITPYFPPDHWGGIETHVMELCKHAKNHSLTVVTSRFGRSAPAHDELPNGTKICRFASLENPNITKIFPRTYNPYIPFLRDKLAHMGDFDLVHVHGQEYFMSHGAISYASKRGIPRVLTIHHTGQAFSGYPLVRFARSILERSYFKATVENASIAIAVSRPGLDYLSCFRTRAATLIPNGIDLERFVKLEKTSDYVLFVGRLEPLKAPHIFLKAVPLILRSAQTHFLIVGSGSMLGYLRRLAKDLEVSNYVTFQENLSYDELAGTICRASVFVAPANAYYTILEAGAARKPVVTVRSEWNEEALGDTAIYVEPDDVAALADSVIKLLRDEQSARKVGQRAYEFVKRNRDWRVIYPRIDEVYKRLC